VDFFFINSKSFIFEIIFGRILRLSDGSSHLQQNVWNISLSLIRSFHPSDRINHDIGMRLGKMEAIEFVGLALELSVFAFLQLLCSLMCLWLWLFSSPPAFAP
jgi:hypothetical protein